MLLKDTIIDLCGLSAPSGFEDPAFARASELLAPYVDEIQTDVMGNLIAVKRCGRPGAKKLLLDAHMDEIGLIVTGIEKGGFLRFSSIGGVDPRMLPAREIKVLTEPPLFGVIDTLPPHTLSISEMDQAFDPKKLFIDVGLSEETAKKTVPLGTPAVFAGGVRAINDNTICGKSLDDRSCVAILIKVMERLAQREPNLDVYCLFSTQEEIGRRGAITGTYAINPDYALAVDVTFASTPDTKKFEALELRKGPAIGVGPNLNRSLTSLLVSAAEDKDIPYQREVLGGDTGTNAWVIEVSREGVPTALVSLPIRYMHSPVELLDLEDAEAAVKLIAEFAVRLGESGSR